MKWPVALYCSGLCLWRERCLPCERYIVYIDYYRVVGFKILLIYQFRIHMPDIRT